MTTPTSQQLLSIHNAVMSNRYTEGWGNDDWMGDAVATTETLDDFIASAKNYAECSVMKRGMIGGVPFIVWKNVQPRKGDTRRSLAVWDFGGVRYAIDSDMGDFLA